MHVNYSVYTVFAIFFNTLDIFYTYFKNIDIAECCLRREAEYAPERHRMPSPALAARSGTITRLRDP